MQSYDLSDSEWQVVCIMRKFKPYERAELMADGEGRPDTYIVTQSSKRMILGGKQVFMQMRSGGRMSDNLPNDQ
jgi:hypothetical protein